MTDNSNMMEISEEEAAKILDSLRTRNVKELYESRCIRVLLDSSENFMHHCEDKFRGVKPASVKSQLADIIKEKELPLIVNKSDEWGVFLLKVA